MIRKYSDILLPVFLLVIVSLVFILTDLDLVFHSNFYNAESGWFLKDVQPWKFFYHNGNLPALIIAVGALILLALSPYYDKIRQHSKQALYLVLVMALGPGLLINAVLKDNWGRPRPRNIEQFGGKHQYEEVLLIDTDSSGKSFPCGHCSMGFYFFAFYFIFRKRKQYLAAALVGFALIWGGLIGFARIVQGGHFLSDVLWSAALTFLTAGLLYRLLKLETKPQFILKKHKRSKRYSLVSVFATFLIFVAIILTALATPYSRAKVFRPQDSINTSQDHLQADLDLLSSEIEIRAAEDLRIDLTAAGFGFPKSRIKTKFSTERQGSTYLLTYQQKLRGYFTELTQDNKIILPEGVSGELSINSPEGNLTLYIPEDSNWLIVPFDVEKIIDPNGYLERRREITKNHEKILDIKLNLSLGTLKIVR